MATTTRTHVKNENTPLRFLVDGAVGAAAPARFDVGTAFLPDPLPLLGASSSDESVEESLSLSLSSSDSPCFGILLPFGGADESGKKQVWPDVLSGVEPPVLNGDPGCERFWRSVAGLSSDNRVKGTGFWFVLPPFFWPGRNEFSPRRKGLSGARRAVCVVLAVEPKEPARKEDGDPAFPEEG